MMPSETGNAAPSDRRVTAVDGYALAATLFDAHDSDTAVLINSATAVPRGFYRRFASYLQALGWTAVTYDYRGIGGSAPRSLRRFDATMRDWALLDMSAMVEWVANEFRPRRLFAIGHSFGGQAFGMLTNANRIDAMVGVSAQSGYWGVQGGKERTRVRFIVTVAMPVLSRVVGYFPWSWFASGADLPKGVALEWAGWCRDPDYLLGDKSLPLDNYRKFTSPVLAYSIDDDDWGTRRAVDDMMRAYTNVTRRHIAPADFGVSRLGHLGFFREGSEAIWHGLVDWLDTAAPRQAL